MQTLLGLLVAEKRGFGISPANELAQPTGENAPTAATLEATPKV